jgi:hypothetical protein
MGALLTVPIINIIEATSKVIEDEDICEVGTTTIRNLDSSSYELIKPISVLVQKEDGVFLASFVDANINASGESQSEAILMLKSSIASRFRFYTKNEAKLSSDPQQQLAVLRKFVREK